MKVVGIRPRYLQIEDLRTHTHDDPLLLTMTYDRFREWAVLIQRQRQEHFVYGLLRNHRFELLQYRHFRHFEQTCIYNSQ